MVAIDGSKLVFGRLASRVAKKLLNGEEVHVANCENIVITGEPQVTIGNFLTRRRLQNKGTPEHSPHWPKTPILLVRRMIRGMLPWKTNRGKDAFRKLRVYAGNPKNLKLEKMDEAKFQSERRSMTIGELCKQLGHSG
jgi:large subunit ribosomal protein L13